jgi:hypothetical protein
MMKTDWYGVISSGVIVAGSRGYAVKAGMTIELTDDDAAHYLAQAPENFVRLPDGAAWNSQVAARFLPSGDCFKLLHDEEGLVDFFSKGVAPSVPQEKVAVMRPVTKRSKK